MPEEFLRRASEAEIDKLEADRAGLQLDLNWQRLRELRDRHFDGQLTPAEVEELHRDENLIAGTPYGQVVAAMFVFPRYLDMYPELIRPFIAALWMAGHNAYGGIKNPADLREFLASKGYIDNDLGAAMANHPAEFEAAITSLET